WFFEALAYPRTHPLVVANGVAMAVVFFLVRIAVMPPYWAKVFGTFGTPASGGLDRVLCLFGYPQHNLDVITGKLRGGK
ncbi:hypothetical protein M9458_005344, partial [Cirrhinus mrigala]